jgi:two-component system, NtrC family, response regulator GlrR
MGKVIPLPYRVHRHRSGHRPGHRPHQVLLAYAGRARREYLAIFLASRGYEVTTCRSGREALDHLAAAHFDLVVTGILMPYLDGLELVRALRRRPGPPVIAVTDSSSRMDGIYLRNATLCGALATHTFSEAEDGLLTSMDWILQGRDDVIKDVVW